eukprot:scaffold199968_cov36-Tisochrysis_lutea.AAC.2
MAMHPAARPSHNRRTQPAGMHVAPTTLIAPNALCAVQVMAAVEEYGAREDPAFKAILQRIAQALNGALA